MKRFLGFLKLCHKLCAAYCDTQEKMLASVAAVGHTAPPQSLAEEIRDLTAGRVENPETTFVIQEGRSFDTATVTLPDTRYIEVERSNGVYHLRPYEKPRRISFPWKFLPTNLADTSDRMKMVKALLYAHRIVLKEAAIKSPGLPPIKSRVSDYFTDPGQSDLLDQSDWN